MLLLCGQEAAADNIDMLADAESPAGRSALRTCAARHAAAAERPLYIGLTGAVVAAGSDARGLRMPIMLASKLLGAKGKVGGHRVWQEGDWRSRVALLGGGPH